MIQLLNIDCMDYMATCQDKQFELAIVDPPYGIGANEMTMGLNNGSIIRSKTQWDNKIPNDKYFNELFRISKNQIIWGGNYFGMLWPAKCFIVWDKRTFVIPHRNMADSELAWCSFDQVSRTARIVWDGFNKGKEIDKIKIHPTQKPVDLYKWLLKNYAKAGDKILDTHGGSMSIALACYDMGFDLTLCEIDKEYYDAGVKRYNDIPKNQFLSPEMLYPNIHTTQ